MQEASTVSLQTVNFDQPCIRCGYSLRGLAFSAICPECGTQVRRTLEGDLLEFSDLDYLRRLRVGAGMIFMSLLVLGGLLVLSLFTALARAQSVAIGLASLHLVVFVVFLSGWWQITPPNPSRSPGGKVSWSRTLVRVAVVLVLVSLPLLIVGEVLKRSPFALSCVIAGSSFGLAGLPLGFFAGLSYVQRLAWRIPDMKIKRRAEVIIASSPVVAVVGVVVTFIGVMDHRHPVVQWIVSGLALATFCVYVSLFLLLYAALRAVRSQPSF